MTPPSNVKPWLENSRAGRQQCAGVVLEQVEQPCADDAAERRERDERVHRLDIQVALTQPACGEHGTDQDPDGDRQSMPRQRQRPELDLGVDVDRDHRRRSHRRVGLARAHRSEVSSARPPTERNHYEM